MKVVKNFLWDTYIKPEILKLITTVPPKRSCGPQWEWVVPTQTKTSCFLLVFLKNNFFERIFFFLETRAWRQVLSKNMTYQKYLNYIFLDLGWMRWDIVQVLLRGAGSVSAWSEPTLNYSQLSSCVNLGQGKFCPGQQPGLWDEFWVRLFQTNLLLNHTGLRRAESFSHFSPVKENWVGSELKAEEIIIIKLLNHLCC